MLENLSIPHYAIARPRENVTGADNQQERPVGNRIWRASARFVEGHDFSRAVTAAKLMGLQPLRFRFRSRWNPQRLYARFQRNVCWKRYSPNCMATCREWQKCPLLI